jgi:hypothetical protein
MFWPFAQQRLKIACRIITYPYGAASHFDDLASLVLDSMPRNNNAPGPRLVIVDELKIVIFANPRTTYRRSLR